MATYKYEGVEYEFENIETELRHVEELKCPICLELVYDPVQTSCGHLFCGKCIKGRWTCPVDDTQFTSTNTDNFNDRRVCNFKVKCPNKGRGCQWQGYLGGAKKYTNRECGYITVVCKGCGLDMERRKLDNHRNNLCSQRKYNCPYCYQKGTHQEIVTTHFTTCEEMPLPCPGGCSGRRIARRNMADHLSEDCPNELVPCTYAIAGCQQIVKRKDLQQHLQDKDKHLDIVLSSYVSQSLLLRDLAYAVKYSNHENVQASLLPLPFCTWLQSTPTCYPHPPWVIKVERFQEKKEKGEDWSSDPVYSHFGGHKMCLRVFANGHSEGKGTHVSVYITLMRGDNDDNLKWPFKGTIKVSLLNQLEDGQHHTREPWSPDVPEDVSGRVTEEERANKSYGRPLFISHRDLKYNGDKNCQYLKDDTLFFRVDRFDLKLD